LLDPLSLLLKLLKNKYKIRWSDDFLGNYYEYEVVLENSKISLEGVG
jgi:hypothetical protein